MTTTIIKWDKASQDAEYFRDALVNKLYNQGLECDVLHTVGYNLVVFPDRYEQNLYLPITWGKYRVHLYKK